MFENNEIPDGGQVSPRNQPCKLCTCNKGVISCAEQSCDCERWGQSNSITKDICCPHCDPKKSCRHQELNHLIFKSGEQWIYQCQTCECLVIKNSIIAIIQTQIIVPHEIFVLIPINNSCNCYLFVSSSIIFSMVKLIAGKWNVPHYHVVIHYHQSLVIVVHDVLMIHAVMLEQTVHMGNHVFIMDIHIPQDKYLVIRQVNVLHVPAR